MRTLSTAAALLALTATSMSLAQPAPGQDGRSDSATERQTTSAANWTSSATAPEQAGDLYQAKTRGSGDFGAATPQNDPLPGALNPSDDPLNGGKQPAPKD